MNAADSYVPIVRDILVPAAFFDDGRGGLADPRAVFETKGVAFHEDDSLAYDPASQRLFLRSDATTVREIEALVETRLGRTLFSVRLTHRILEATGPYPVEDGGPAEPGSPSEEASRLGILRVLPSVEQTEAFLDKVVGEGSGATGQVSSSVSNPGEFTGAWIGDALTRALPAVSADGTTVTLAFSLYRGRSGEEIELLQETTVAVPSGGSVAFEERVGKDAWRFRLVTAAVLDATGEPLAKKHREGLPDGGHPKGGGSLFPGPVPEPALEKVKAIVIPRIDFEATPLAEALEKLKQASAEHDTDPSDEGRGIDIQLRYGSPEALGEMPVTLRLAHVPLATALEQVSKLVGCSYRVEGGAAVVGDFPDLAVPEMAYELWYRAFLELREAETLEKAEDKAGARSRLDRALQLCLSLRTVAPEFHPEIVAKRIRDLRLRLEEKPEEK